MNAKQVHIVCTSCAQTNRLPAAKLASGARCGRCHKPLASDQPVEVDGPTFQKLRARDEAAFVLDVWAPWCGPCRMMAPAYAKAAEHFGGRVRFLKLNSEDNPDAASQLNVRGIPALFIIQNGKTLSQQAGALPADALIQWVEQSDLVNQPH